MIVGILIMMGALINGALMEFNLQTVIFFILGFLISGVCGLMKFKKSMFNMRKRAIIYIVSVCTIILMIFLVDTYVSNLSPLEELNAGLKKSASLLGKKDLETGIRELESLSSKYPDEPLVYLNLSTAYLMQRNPEKAFSLLDRSAQGCRLEAKALFNYAMAFYQKGAYADASEYLSKSIQQDPFAFNTWIYASESALREKDLKAAEYFAALAVNIWPKRSEARYQLAKVKLESMQFQDATKYLNEALKLNPTNDMQTEIMKLLQEAQYYQKNG